MTRFEYKDPEFNVVLTAAEDILTASQGGGDEPTPSEFDPENPGGFVTPIIG